MFGFLFRSNWGQPYRAIFWLYLTLFIIACSLVFLAFLVGPYNAFDWTITSETELIKIPLLEFNLGLFEIELLNDNYLVKQYFGGSDLRVDPLDHIWMLVFVGLGLALLLTVITYFSTFWFTACMGVFTVILIAFQLNYLQLFGTTGREALIGFSVVFLSTGFFFQAIRPQSTMLVRLLSFLTLMVIIAGIIYQFSGVSQPFFHLANYGMMGFLVLSLFFILLIGHEIVFLILYLVTQSKGDVGSNNSTHFIVFTLVYIANIALVYSRNAGYIDWDILYVHAFILLLLSAFIGLWTFERREEAYRGILSFYPYAGLLYLAMGIICMATLRYQMVIANDPLMEVFEDAIVFSHLAFGTMFFIYVIANYVNPLLENLAVHRIVYQDNNFPYATAMLGSIIVVVALYFISNEAPRNQTIAGYYNLIGDLYVEDNPAVARRYYSQGSDYGYQNHRSNYMLGQLNLSEKKVPAAIVNFKTAISKHPTPHAYINLGNAYRKQNIYFDALFTMQRAYRDFPEDGAVKNNLGMLFSRTDINDSTLYFLGGVSSDPVSSRVAQANLMAIHAEKALPLSSDSLKTAYEKMTSLPIKANTRAYANRYFGGLNDEFDEGFASDSTLNAHTLSYLINASTDPSNFSTDQGNLARGYGKYPFNGSYQDQLVFVDAWIQYNLEKVGAAFRQMDVVSFNTSPQQSYYQHALGVLSLHQGAPRLAADYFEKSIRVRPSDTTNLVLAYLESDQLAKARPFLYKLPTGALRDDLMSAVLLEDDKITNTSDQIRYLALRYRMSSLDSLTIQDILGSFQEPAYQANAQLLVTQHFLKLGDLNTARFHLGQVSQDFDDKVELQRTLLENLSYLMEGDIGHVDLSASNRYRGEGSWDGMQKLFEALEANISQDSIKSSGLFEQLGYNNPFFEEGVLQSVRYFNSEGDKFKSYDILLKAIDINRYSVELIKAYVMQALEIRHEEYAESAIIRLIDLMSSEDFGDFEREFSEKKNELGNRDDSSVFGTIPLEDG